MFIYLKDKQNFVSEKIDVFCELELPKLVGLVSKIINISAVGEISKEGDSYKVFGNFKTELTFVCDRCLADTKILFDIPFEENFSEFSSDEEVFTFEGNEIDLSRAFLNNILLNIPLKVLCKEDCLGLCPICGQNLNNAACDCDTTDYDPRFSQLRSLFLEKEV